jgi:hypothetical protein
MHTLQGLEREALGGASRDVDQKLRFAPPLVLLGVDVERRAADLAESHVVRSCRQLPILEADRGGAIAAAPGLEERERPVGGLETMNHLEGGRGCPNSRRRVSRVRRSVHYQKNPMGLGS